MYQHFGKTPLLRCRTHVAKDQRQRGFGFVEMASGGNEAIQALNGKEVGGRNLTVNLAKPREDRRSSRW